METRANYVLIGAFTLAAVVGAFLFIMWIAGYGAAGGHRSYQVVFNGSVAGLSTGANVSFNGIKVGEVTHLTFSRSDPHQVVADIDVNSEAPIDKNTKARLETQGLTGGGGGRPPGRADRWTGARWRKWPAAGHLRRSVDPAAGHSGQRSGAVDQGDVRFWTTPTRSLPKIPRRSIRRSRTSISFRRRFADNSAGRRRSAEERRRTRQADRAVGRAPANACPTTPIGSFNRSTPTRFARS